MIAQPVEIDEQPRIDRFFAAEFPADALRATAYRSRLMKKCIELAAAGERERVERRKLLLHPIHLDLEPPALFRSDPKHPVVFGSGRGRKLAADIEELILNPAQPLFVPGKIASEPFLVIGEERTHDADRAVEFIDGAIGFEPEALFRHARAPDQGGRAFVAAARINAREPDRHAIAPDSGEAGPFAERGVRGVAGVAGNRQTRVAPSRYDHGA